MFALKQNIQINLMKTRGQKLGVTVLKQQSEIKQTYSEFK